MTNSLRAGLQGSQRPRLLFRPEHATEEHGLEAIDLAESVGLHLDPWQQLCVRVALAEDARGMYAASEVAALVARQNGKGGWLEAVVLDGLFLVGDPLTLWTAHQFKTTGEAFLRIKGWIDGSDDLRKKVKKISSSHGEESIETTSGARLRFIARSKSSGRGFSPQRIVWDEAQELSRLAVEAALPAMTAQRNPQSIYVGTVPGPETNNPEHFTRLRDRGRAREGKRLAWLEWSPKGSDDPATAAKINLGSRKVWAEANPGLGYRITEDSLQAVYDSLDPESFARETCSIWPTEAHDIQSAIDLERWAALANPSHPKPKGAVVLVVDVSPDRATSTIGVAGAGRGGRICLLSRSGKGTAWVADTLLKLYMKHDVAEIALHPSSQAGSLIPELLARDLEFNTLTATDLGQACAAFIDNVARKRPRYVHLGQAELDAAVRNARTRFTGEATLWDRKDRAVDISPLVAVSTAAYRFDLLADYDVMESIG